MATSLKIDDTLKNRIHRLASQRRRSPHWIMLEAIQQYVEREEKREAFKQDALCAWETHQRTGLHLTTWNPFMNPFHGRQNDLHAYRTPGRR